MYSEASTMEIIGLIAGNGTFPLRFAEAASAKGVRVAAVAHRGETLAELEGKVESLTWIRVGELGRIISTFKRVGAKHVAMVGGINRVRLFGGVKLDLRGMMLMARLRSTKDDVIMRGIADELKGEGIEVVPSTIFLEELLCPEGNLTRVVPDEEELTDIQVGIEALKAISAQDIGQLVVVREGVVVAVEAVEGSNAAILRGGQLGGRGTVVIKFAKPTQDMRFDVPVVGPKTVETLIESGARVLALEAGRCLIMDPDEVVRAANRHGISIVGCPAIGARLGGVM